MERNQDIVDLVYKYIREELSPEENERLQRWVNESPANAQFFKEATQPGRLFAESVLREEIEATIDLDEVWQKLLAKGLPATSITAPAVRKARLFRFRLTMYAVAASVALLILAGMYLYNRPAKPRVVQASTKHQSDVAPNTGEPLLTLADGRQVPLSSNTNGTLATQGNVTITRNANGEIVYSKGATDGSAVSYNTVSVPKGGNVVAIVLADKTKVWLNAASSIRYPTAFTGEQRNVAITGEAYFEVTPMKLPFIVSKGNTAVRVLGTHFNVNAYDDEENLKVTLLEGRVKVTDSKTGNQATITPGQQAVVNSNGKLAVNKDIDTDVVMAWKNGLFVFDNSSMEAIMKQVQRWYNVEVIYQGDVKRWTFNGQLSRYSNVSKVLELMEATGTVHFKIADRTIYVTP